MLFILVSAHPWVGHGGCGSGVWSPVSSHGGTACTVGMLPLGLGSAWPGVGDTQGSVVLSGGGAQRASPRSGLPAPVLWPKGSFPCCLSR